MTRQRTSEVQRLEKFTSDLVAGNNFNDFPFNFVLVFNKRQMFTCFDDQRVWRLSTLYFLCFKYGTSHLLFLFFLLDSKFEGKNYCSGCLPFLLLLFYFSIDRVILKQERFVDVKSNCKFRNWCLRDKKNSASKKRRRRKKNGFPNLVNGINDKCDGVTRRHRALLPVSGIRTGG